MPILLNLQEGTHTKQKAEVVFQTSILSERKRTSFSQALPYTLTVLMSGTFAEKLLSRQLCLLPSMPAEGFLQAFFMEAEQMCKRAAQPGSYPFVMALEKAKKRDIPIAWW